MLEGKIGRTVLRSLLVAMLGMGFAIATASASSAALADEPADTGYTTILDQGWG